MLTIENAQRVARLVHFGFLFSIAIFFFLLEYFIHPAANPANRNIYIVFVVICIVILNSLVYLRQNFIAKSVEILRSSPTDQAALMRWNTGQFITFASCEAVALFGFVARMLGAPRTLGLALFGVGAYTLIIYRPKPIREQ